MPHITASGLKPGTWSVDRASIDPAFSDLWVDLEYMLPLFEQTGVRTEVHGFEAQRFRRNQVDIPSSITRVPTDSGVALDFPEVAFNLLDLSYAPHHEGTWMFVGSIDGTSTINRIYGSHDAFESRIGASGGLFRIENHFFAAGAEQLKGPFTLEANTVHVVVLTWNFTTNRQEIYYNGVLVASGSDANDPPGTGALWLGGRSVPFFNGKILHTAQWHRVLGAGEVQLLQLDPFGMFREVPWPTWPALPAAAPDVRLPLRIRRPVYYPRRKREQVFT